MLVEFEILTLLRVGEAKLVAHLPHVDDEVAHQEGQLQTRESDDHSRQ